MYTFTNRNPIYRCVSVVIIVFISFSLILSPSASYAQSFMHLPVPGAMVMPTDAYVPTLIKGMTLHPEDPLLFDFIVDSGHSDLEGDQLKEESDRLIKYFLASLTVPKDDLWVNLSPYEEDRIITDPLSKTELGQELLAQDYLLKQLTASLMYPEDDLGREFWNKIYAKAQEKYGTTDIPVDTFNKVWIMPQRASVYENEQTVYVVDSKLKVLLEQDYLALEQSKKTIDHRPSTIDQTKNTIATEIIRDIIIPEIEKEVNQGEHFAPLRQIFHSLILAKWYKETIKESILSQVYVDQNKIAGIDTSDPQAKQKVYEQYMEAYKKGVYDYIKEDYDPASQEVIPRKYFSGGIKDSAMAHTPTNVPLLN